jgi:hypothetical protein
MLGAFLCIFAYFQLLYADTYHGYLAQVGYLYSRAIRVNIRPGFLEALYAVPKTQIHYDNMYIWTENNVTIFVFKIVPSLAGSRSKDLDKIFL